MVWSSDYIDRNGRTWHTIVSEAQRRISSYRDQLESPGIAERDADSLRGRISELKELIEKPVIAGMQQSEPQDYTY